MFNLLLGKQLLEEFDTIRGKSILFGRRCLPDGCCSGNAFDLGCEGFNDHRPIIIDIG